MIVAAKLFFFVYGTLCKQQHCGARDFERL